MYSLKAQTQCQPCTWHCQFPAGAPRNQVTAAGAPAIPKRTAADFQATWIHGLRLFYVGCIRFRVKSSFGVMVDAGPVFFAYPWLQGFPQPRLIPLFCTRDRRPDGQTVGWSDGQHGQMVRRSDGRSQTLGVERSDGRTVRCLDGQMVARSKPMRLLRNPSCGHYVCKWGGAAPP